MQEFTTNEPIDVVVSIQSYFYLHSLPYSDNRRRPFRIVYKVMEGANLMKGGSHLWEVSSYW